MFKYKYNCILIFYLITFSLFFSSCEYSNLSKKTDENTKEYKLAGGTKGEPGVGLSFLDMNGDINSNAIFYLNEPESFKKYIYIYHGYKEISTYKLLLFCDYKQSKFTVNNKELEEYTFKMEYNQEIKIPIEIKPLKKGFHDVFFILVKNSDIKRLDEEFRISTTGKHMLFIRFNIIIEQKNIPKIYFLSNLDEKENSKMPPIFTSRNVNTRKMWLTDTIKTATKLEFFSRITNTSNEDKNFAIINLLDFKQIPINENGDLVTFFKVKNEREVVIPSSLTTPKQPGIYDLTPILIYNPYEELVVYNTAIKVSNRIGLNVVN